MNSITVRALILAFAFGICIAGDFQKKDSRCKIGEENRDRVFEEMKKNFTECLESTKPGTNLKAYHENPKILSKEENIEVLICVNMKREVISPDRVYVMAVALQGIEEMEGTDQETKDELTSGLTACEEGNDPAKDCEKIMHCVHKVIAKVCFNHDMPEFEA